MLRSKLEHKALLIIIIALISGLGLSVVISIKRESDNLADQYRVRSLLFGDTLMTGFRNADPAAVITRGERETFS